MSRSNAFGDAPQLLQGCIQQVDLDVEVELESIQSVCALLQVHDAACMRMYMCVDMRYSVYHIRYVNTHIWEEFSIRPKKGIAFEFGRLDTAES